MAQSHRCPGNCKNFAGTVPVKNKRKGKGMMNKLTILMVLADIASRLLIAPQSLPVGVVTALVGVPFFAIIIYRSGNKP